MKQPKTNNWTVTTYDENDEIIESFEIKDRTQDEANREAMSYVENHLEIADWTLSVAPATPANAEQGNEQQGEGFTEREERKDTLDKVQALIGYLQIWQRGGVFPPELNQVIEQALDWQLSLAYKIAKL